MGGLFKLAVFIGYYLVLVQVPKKRGIVYRDRLKAYLAQDQIGYVLDYMLALASLGSCVMSILEAVVTNDRAPTTLFIIEDMVSTFLLAYLFLQLYISRERMRYLFFRLQSWIDIFTIAPIMYWWVLGTGYGFESSELFGIPMRSVSKFFRMLRLLRLSRALNLLVIRVRDAIKLQLVRLITKIITLLAFSTGFVHWLGQQGFDYFTQSEPLSFNDALYFVLTTVSTVGYGDISPTTAVGRMFIVVVMLTGAYIVSVETDKLSKLMDMQSSHKARFRWHPGGRHIIVCCGVRCSGLPTFLREFFHEDHGLQDSKVVLLIPEEPDFTMKATLLNYSRDTRVHYINGDVLSNEDLVKARADVARGVFLLADLVGGDAHQQDMTTVLRALNVRKFDPTLPIYAQLVRPENRRYITANRGSALSRVVCVNEMKNSLVARSCLCLGFSTLITNLIASSNASLPDDGIKSRSARMIEAAATAIGLGPTDDGEGDRPSRRIMQWQREYLHGMGMEMYSVELAAMFARHPFNRVSHAIFTHYSAILLGIAKPRDGMSPVIMLNPGRHYTLTEGDVGILIAEDSTSVDPLCSEVHDDILVGILKDAERAELRGDIGNLSAGLSSMINSLSAKAKSRLMPTRAAREEELARLQRLKGTLLADMSSFHLARGRVKKRAYKMETRGLGLASMAERHARRHGRARTPGGIEMRRMSEMVDDDDDDDVDGDDPHASPADSVHSEEAKAADSSAASSRYRVGSSHSHRSARAGGRVHPSPAGARGPPRGPPAGARSTTRSEVLSLSHVDGVPTETVEVLERPTTAASRRGGPVAAFEAFERAEREKKLAREQAEREERERMEHERMERERVESERVERERIERERMELERAGRERDDDAPRISTISPLRGTRRPPPGMMKLKPDSLGGRLTLGYTASSSDSSGDTGGDATDSGAGPRGDVDDYDDRRRRHRAPDFRDSDDSEHGPSVHRFSPRHVAVSGAHLSSGHGARARDIHIVAPGGDAEQMSRLQALLEDAYGNDSERMLTDARVLCGALAALKPAAGGAAAGTLPLPAAAASPTAPPVVGASGAPVEPTYARRPSVVPAALRRPSVLLGGKSPDEYVAERLAELASTGGRRPRHPHDLGFAGDSDSDDEDNHHHDAPPDRFRRLPSRPMSSASRRSRPASGLRRAGGPMSTAGSDMEFEDAGGMRPRTGHSSTHLALAREVDEADNVADTDHILVLSSNFEDLFHFMVPLRTMEEFHHDVVILSDTPPSEREREVLADFGRVKFVEGSPRMPAMLLVAGVDRADFVVILSDSSGSDQTSVSSDAGALLTALDISDTLGLDCRSVAVLNDNRFIRHLRNAEDESTAALGGVAQQLEPSYVSGKVIISSFTELLLSQAFFNPYIVDITESLMWAEKPEELVPSGKTVMEAGVPRKATTLLAQIPLPYVFVGKQFHQLFDFLVLRLSVVPLGLLRNAHNFDRREFPADEQPFVLTNPPKDLALVRTDRVYVLTPFRFIPLLRMKQLLDDTMDLEEWAALFD
eukprot:PLAT1612.1.p1 GENE.PLAT1612.1~~PLAT1612.1.p1  ORF type:complete len:1578 (+),score=844.35 PLAT1612.1:152-4735(+)